MFFLLPPNQIKSKQIESDSVDKSDVSTRKTKKQRTEGSDVAAAESDLGFEPDEILGANEFDGKLKFRIKVKGSDDWKIVRAKQAHAACPELVIDFYEKHVLLNGVPLIRNNWCGHSLFFTHKTSLTFNPKQKLWIFFRGGAVIDILQLLSQIHNSCESKFNLLLQ